MSEHVDRAEILPLLGSVRKQGGWVMAYCPAHLDGAKHKAGQNAGRRDDGRSLGLSDEGVLKCFNGCSFASIMAGLRAKAPREAAQGPQRRETATGWHETAVYDFRRPDGTLVAQHVRLEAPDPASPKGYSKRFVWRISSEDRRSLRDAGLGIEDLPLWGLSSIDKHEWVNWTEGEKAGTALHVRGEACVTSGGGASQQAFGKSLEPLRGKKVRIWPDNDEPGAKYALAVKRALQGIAAKVVIMPPVDGPGGDLHDYFAAGGQLDALLAGALTEDQIAYLGDGHVRVRMPTEFGEVAFEIEELEDTRRELSCELTVTHKDAQAPEPYTQRVNLLSSSAVEGLSRQLARHFPAKLTWTSLVMRAVQHVREYLRNQPLLESEAPSLDFKPADWIIPGYVARGAGTVLFGLPGKGKTQTALAMAVSMDAGLHDGVFPVQRPYRTLVINLERDRRSVLARIARINMALGLDPARPIGLINRRGAGLGAMIPAIRRLIAQEGYEVLVLDSISRAGYGDLNANQVANSWADALNSLGCAWLAIGHSPRPREDAKGPTQGHLYGSVFQDAAADIMIGLESKHINEGLITTMRVTKANDSRPPEDLDLCLTFDEDGLIGIEPATPEQSEVVAFVKATIDKLERVRLFLRDAVMGSREDIAAAVGVDLRHVNRYINPLLSKGVVTVEYESTGKGRKAIYRLADDAPSLAPGAHHGVSSSHQTPAPLSPLRGSGAVVQSGADGVDLDQEDAFQCVVCSQARAGFYLDHYRDEDAGAVCAGCA